MNVHAPPPPSAPPLGLSQALDSLFDGPTPPTPAALTEFAAALTAARAAALFPADPQAPALTLAGRDDAPEAARAAAARALGAGHALRVGSDRVAAPITLFDGTPAALAVRMQPGAEMALALAHERLELLRRLCARHWRDGGGAQAMLAAAAAAARGDQGGAQEMLELLAARWGAAQAALTPVDGGGRAAFSRGAAPTRRAAAPAALRARALAALAGPDAAAEGVFVLGEGPRSRALVVDGGAPDAGDVALLGAVWRGAGRARARGGLRKRALGILAPLALLAIVLAVPVEDSVSVPAELAAATRRVVTAPFDGRIAAVEARLGDRAVAGQTVLFRMDDGPLRLERARLVADQSAAALERERARAVGDAARAHAAELKVARAGLALEAVEARLAAAVQTAAIDGEVTGADPKLLEGAFVGLGARVSELADPAGLRLVARIPARARGRVAVGDVLVFAPDAAPTLEIQAPVAVIDLLAQAPETGGGYMAYSAPIARAEGLAPAMRGAARLAGPQMPLGALLWGRLRDWALIRLWL